LEVISNGHVVAELSDGSFVGEVSLVFEQKRSVCSPCSICLCCLSVCFLSLFIFSKK
jgi:hypothetical protein